MVFPDKLVDFLVSWGLDLGRLVFAIHTTGAKNKIKKNQELGEQKEN